MPILTKRSFTEPKVTDHSKLFYSFTNLHLYNKKNLKAVTTVENNVFAGINIEKEK